MRQQLKIYISPSGALFMKQQILDQISPQLRRIREMTDESGIAQHVENGVPMYELGNSVDDQARATICLARAYPEWNDFESLERYLGFIERSQRPDGYFNNYQDQWKNWCRTGEGVSQDCYGRVIWALGEVIKSGLPHEYADRATVLLFRNLESAKKLDYPISKALTLIGLTAYLEKHNFGDIKRIASGLGEDLIREYKRHSSRDWHWFADEMSYSVGRVPQALLKAGRILGNDQFVRVGKEALDFAVETCFREDVFWPVGNDGWYPRGGNRALYDQQPLEAGAMAEACFEAYRGSGELKYAELAKRAFLWYHGSNSAGADMRSPEGGIYDGIGKMSVNKNQGAENIVTYVLSALSIADVADEGKHQKELTSRLPENI